MAAKNLSMELHENWLNRKAVTTIENEVIIKRPIDEVFKAVTTAKLFAEVYPQTVSVGGITQRPFKKGDLVLERFLFGGTLFSVFQYEVDVYEPPRKILFHGRTVSTNYLLSVFAEPLIKNMTGSFEYSLEEVDKDTTRWVRRVHFSYVGNVLTWLFYFIFTSSVLPSQRKGAKMYVEYVKRFLESPNYQSQLYGSDIGHWTTGGEKYEPEHERSN